MGNPPLMYSENIHVAINGGPQHHAPSGKATGLPISPFRAISPFRDSRRLRPLVVAPEGSRVKHESTSSSGKIASNDKHKQSEKHRRDEMGAYVLAADIIRGSLHPGILSHCNVCIENMSFQENLCSSSTLPENVAAVATGGVTKRTKNQSLEEGLMWDFSMVLHISPHEIGSCLDDIRALAGQMWREKQLGKNNHFTKSNKWEADSRVEVLTEELRKMRYACEQHDVPPCACGKHEVEDWPNASLGTLMTPPSSSSTTSPMMGQKRSRETSEEAEEEKEEGRRTRRRVDTRL
jgi:hypothetical protein